MRLIKYKENTVYIIQAQGLDDDESESESWNLKVNLKLKLKIETGNWNRIQELQFET